MVRDNPCQEIQRERSTHANPNPCRALIFLYKLCGIFLKIIFEHIQWDPRGKSSTSLCEFVCVRVCVCVGPWENLCGIQLGAHIQATNEQATTCCLRLTWATTQGGGKCCRWVSLSLSDSLPPYTRKSKSKVCRHVELWSFCPFAPAQGEWECKLSMRERAEERERAIWVFFCICFGSCSLCLSLPLTTCGVWRWTRFVVFAFLCFSSLAHTKAQTALTHTHTCGCILANLYTLHLTGAHVSCLIHAFNFVGGQY